MSSCKIVGKVMNRFAIRKAHVSPTYWNQDSWKGGVRGTLLTKGFNEKKSVTSGNLLLSSTGILISCSWQIAPGSVMWRLHKKGSLEQDLHCPVPPASALEAFSPFLFFVTLGLNIYSTSCERKIGRSYHPALWRNKLCCYLPCGLLGYLSCRSLTGALPLLFIFRVCVCVLPSAFGNTKRKK